MTQPTLEAKINHFLARKAREFPELDTSFDEAYRELTAEQPQPQSARTRFTFVPHQL